MSMNQIEIYQSEDGSLQLPVALNEDTIWLSQSQIKLPFRLVTPTAL
ncbi:hypothetical protein QX776_16560 [Alteromonadaceae bacterium BrNp21-10]|nr:hypothetical protein [Alteromonadaceae bacterium BrNp21-10]